MGQSEKTKCRSTPSEGRYWLLSRRLTFFGLQMHSAGEVTAWELGTSCPPAAPEDSGNRHRGILGMAQPPNPPDSVKLFTQIVFDLFDRVCLRLSAIRSPRGDRVGSGYCLPSFVLFNVYLSLFLCFNISLERTIKHT